MGGSVGGWCMCVCVGQVVQSGEATLMYFHIPLRFAKYGQAMEKVEVEVGGMIFFFFFFLSHKDEKDSSLFGQQSSSSPLTFKTLIDFTYNYSLLNHHHPLFFILITLILVKCRNCVCPLSAFSRSICTSLKF